ncbi:MAG: metalloendopeptidase [Candidatus Carbobacillus altaicus]|uniref:Metalloendopeptidase n=1 Tax=Candidatus Carbonibacillus altaicus TaxID=2163959 RepID=A0A2R6Y0U4_9BACL|nr:MAG: metalloendopeptidase [Candidatus Carbobacillus altaicus]
MNKKVIIIALIALFLFVIFLPIIFAMSIVEAFFSFFRGEPWDGSEPYADPAFVESAYKRPIKDFLAGFRPEEQAFLKAYTPPWSLVLSVDYVLHQGENYPSDHDAILKRMLPRTVYIEKENTIEYDVCEPLVEPKTGRVIDYTLKTSTKAEKRRLFTRIDAYSGTYTFRPKSLSEEREIGDSPCGTLYERRTEWMEELVSGPDEPYRPLLRLMAAYGSRTRDDLELAIEFAQTIDPEALILPLNGYGKAYVDGADVLPSKEMLEIVEAFYNPDHLDALEKLTWPVPDHTSISSPFGMRFHPIKHVMSLHTGIDIPAPQGVPVQAILEGKVESVGFLGGYGLVVLIDHQNGLKSLYAHLSSAEVKQGDRVEEGDTIGKIGSTGMSTGPHLHFEVRLNNAYTDPVAHYTLKDKIITYKEGAGGEDHY